MADAANVDQLIDALIVREGDYVNNPADKGGPTRFGITQAVARANGYSGDMRSLPRDVAVAIYREKYWLQPRFDQVAKLSAVIAAELFDTGVNSYPTTGVILLQRALNVFNHNGKDYPDYPTDGHIGPDTLHALQRYLQIRGSDLGSRVLLRAIDCLKGARYIALAENSKNDEDFVFGWIANRVNEL